MEEMIIETKGLTRRYGKQTVVDHVNLRVPRGEIYGFLGPNGAGKTTTIRMLLGLTRASAGSVELFGKDLSRYRMDALKKVGSLVESPSYYGHLTGRENLEVIRKLLALPKKRIDDVLAIVRLTKAADRPVKGYSLGMKQRLGIAAALLGNPELLILDEPTNGLDPAGIQEIRELIKHMPKKYGMTVFVSSHLLSEIEQMATFVGIIAQGKLVFQDRIDVLQSRSQPKLALGVERLEEAYQFLQREGYAPRKEGDTIYLPQMGRKRTVELNEALVKQRFGVFRLEAIKPSLEEVFLELTGKGNSL